MLNRKDFSFLRILHENRCIGYFKSMTMQEIATEAKTSKSSVYRSFLKLLKYNMIKKGCLSAKAETYYLTEMAIKSLKTENTKDYE